MTLTTAAYPWHQTALNHITLQCSENRQPHAMLFRFRADYDDTALGWGIVKCLLCDSYSGCGECKHCRLINNEYSHPNALFLDIQNDKVGIEQVRELEQQMWQTSMFDKPKVAYIQGIDLLSLGAQNALLKTLEEPPKNAFFVLSVENLSRVLPTIMSRVQRVQHGRIDEESLRHWLQQQNSGATEATIAKTLKLVNGAPIRASELLQSGDLVAQLEKEKARFAQFMSRKLSAAALAQQLDKDNPQAQLARYCRYTENLIRVLFDKSVDKNPEIVDKRADNRQGNSVQYATWQGVSLRKLYCLHDALLDLQRLADTNVNLPLQLTTRLTDWQHER